MIVFACCFAYAVVAFITAMCLVVGEYREAAREDRTPEFLGTRVEFGVAWPFALVVWAVVRLNDVAKALARVDDLPEVQERKRKALERELGIGQREESQIEVAHRTCPHLFAGHTVNLVEDDGSTHIERLS